ncbi:MAG TPA: hypothetical protein VMC80_03685 [Patescibacteria group bacterium]|nr:hypothetical protein [Patescibacteria group bacterium]
MIQRHIFIFAVIAMIFLAQAGMILADSNLYEQNYSVSNSGYNTNPLFVVQELKYEPYPVSPGDTFDLWVKVQNIGQNDAKNSAFKLDLSYPFSSDNSEQDYGVIFGTANAYQSQQQYGDTSIQANQAVIEFKVKVAGNAPSGENTIKFEAATDKNSGSWISYTLPITISSQTTYTGINSSSQNSDNGYINWVYGAIGFLTGAFIVVLFRLILHKRKKK